MGELRFWVLRESTKKHAVCAFTQVLVKTEPLSAGLPARAR